MRRVVCLVGYLVFLNFDSCTLSCADEIKKVTGDYRDALKSLESKYASVTGSGHIEKQLNLSRTPNTLKYEINFHRSASGAVKYESVERIDTGLGYKKAVTCKNSVYSFYLNQPSANEDRFVVVSAGDDDKLASAKINLNLTTFVDAAFSIFGCPVRKLLDDPGFRIIQVIQESVEPSCLRLEFQCNSDQFDFSRGWIVVRPDLAWALVSYRCERKNGTVLAGSVDYFKSDAEVSDAPIPHFVLFEKNVGTLEDAIPGQRFEFEFDRVNFAKTPESEFFLEHYGFASPIKATSHPVFYFAAIVLGVAGLITFLRIKRSRSR